MLAARRHILFYPTWIFRHSIAGVMSLQALSTEVDALIFGYLDKADKSRLMRVSKAYYETGKPLLYSEIRLGNNQDEKIKLLLLTFLERPKLSKHVLSFYLERDTEESDFEVLTESLNGALDDEFLDAMNGASNHTNRLWNLQEDARTRYVCGRLMSSTVLLEHTINHVSCGGLTAQARLHWLSRALDSSRNYDGALALILCLAPRMRYLHLTKPKERDLHITLGIMQGSCAPTSTGSISPLFEKLETLRMTDFSASNDGSNITVATGLKELILGTHIG
jgi:hypothetical protein